MTPTEPTLRQPRQPFLHDLVILCAAPTQVLSSTTGGIGAHGTAIGAQGILHADLRVLSALELTVDREQPEHIATLPVEADEQGENAVCFTYLLRDVSTGSDVRHSSDVRLDIERRVRPGRVAETMVIGSRLPTPLTLRLGVEMAHDLAPIAGINGGLVPPAAAFDADHPLVWGSDEVEVRLLAPGAAVGLTASGWRLQLDWTLQVPARGEARVGWTLEVTDRGGVVVPATTPPLDVRRIAGKLSGATGDHRLRPWLDRSLKDLNGLRMATREWPENAFFAAGSPWYLTLFGRDSLWTARMLLPVDTAYAMSTLSALARLAGTTVDVDSAQAPGKILHELRRETMEFADLALPPRYYGTIDATPLWVCLLHDAWRAGAAADQVAELLPTLEGALRWMVEYGDADGDGFCEYIDASGHGLTNQGWKDSADAVRFTDGSVADGPVALCEVQAYAYEAAVNGATLLDAFGRPGGKEYRRWAASLADRFRTSFWCGEGPDRFPALALDGAKRRVDSLTSNIGHLLGTGLLDAAEELLVAQRLAGPELDSGLGLRTMSAADSGYAPLSYHCGSVWPHDTAIAILGLHRAGLTSYAAGLIEGLLRASVAFDQRLPELWSGEGLPVPYPAACRPQAWSAAAAVAVAAVLQATADPHPDLRLPG
ncbi:MAG TPA: glycogen debranching N-terminal domain-containing protein [Propionibacteriaceae bacterium]|nr:glycogen debranching N-terminal domain-containing protein [Propionibacteriaceae bacterium]